jgi:hypothetical protein
MLKTEMRVYTYNEMFLFGEFCEHYRDDPHKKEDVDAVREMVQAGGEKCERIIIVQQIVSEHSKNMWHSIHPVTCLGKHLQNVSSRIFSRVLLQGLSVIDELFQKLSLR